MLVGFEHHRPENAFGHVISWWTHQPFSHTATIIDGYRYEALIGDGYVKRPYYKRYRVEITWVELDEIEHYILKKVNDSMVGMKYPKLWYLAFQFIFPPLRDFARRFYCSKACLYAINKAGLYNQHIDVPQAPRPHPGIVFVITEAIKCEREKYMKKYSESFRSRNMSQVDISKEIGVEIDSWITDGYAGLFSEAWDKNKMRDISLIKEFILEKIKSNKSIAIHNTIHKVTS